MMLSYWKCIADVGFNIQGCSLRSDFTYSQLLYFDFKNTNARFSLI